VQRAEARVLGAPADPGQGVVEAVDPGARGQALAALHAVAGLLPFEADMGRGRDRHDPGAHGVEAAGDVVRAGRLQAEAQREAAAASG